jgi:hypothetical protein
MYKFSYYIGINLIYIIAIFFGKCIIERFIYWNERNY